MAISRKKMILVFLGLFSAGMLVLPPVPAQAAKDDPTVFELKSGKPRTDKCADKMNKLKEDKECWPCDVVKSLFGAVTEVTNSVEKAVKSGVMQLIWVGFALWAAWHVLKFVSSVHEGSSGEFIQKIGTGLFRCFFAWLLVEAGQIVVFDTFLNPVAAIGGGFALAANPASGLPDASLALTGGIAGLGKLFEAMTKGIFDSVVELAVIGRGLQCLSFLVPVKLLGKELFTLPVIPLLTMGCLCRIGSMVLMLTFTFKLLDACFRLGIFGALLPLFIAAWAFPITRDFTKKGWDILINAVMTLVVLSVVMRLIITLVIKEAVGYTPQEAMVMLQAGTAEQLKLMQKFDSDGSILRSVAFFIFGFAFLKGVGEIAGHLAGASFSNPGGDGLGAMVGKQMANVGSTAMGAAAAGANVTLGSGASRVLLGKRGADGERTGGMLGQKGRNMLSKFGVSDRGLENRLTGGYSESRRAAMSSAKAHEARAQARNADGADKDKNKVEGAKPSAEQTAAQRQQEIQQVRAEAQAAKAEAQAAKSEAQLAKSEVQTAKGEAQTAKSEAQTAKSEAQTAKGEAQMAKSQGMSRAASADKNKPNKKKGNEHLSPNATAHFSEKRDLDGSQRLNYVDGNGNRYESNLKMDAKGAIRHDSGVTKNEKGQWVTSSGKIAKEPVLPRGLSFDKTGTKVGFEKDGVRYDLNAKGEFAAKSGKTAEFVLDSTHRSGKVVTKTAQNFKQRWDGSNEVHSNKGVNGGGHNKKA